MFLCPAFMIAYTDYSSFLLHFSAIHIPRLR
jgi:hypothetical protein